MSNIFGSLIKSLTAQGVSSSVITSAISSVSGVFNSTNSQVTAKLGSLAALSSNPSVYSVASGAIIGEIEGLIAQPYPQTIPLLEKLRTATDPLVIAQTIAAIEQEI